MARKPKKPKSVETFTHEDTARRNVSTAEYHPVMSQEDKTPTRVAHERRDRRLEPLLA